MRIAIVCPYDIGCFGGVQQITAELAARLGALGDDVLLVAPGSPVAGIPTATLRSVGPTLTVAANQSTVPISLDPRSIRATKAALDEADVVHVHEPFVPLVGWAALACGRPVVATFHAAPPAWTRALYRRLAWAGRRGLGRAHMTAVSETAASALPRSWGSPEIIPNAIDVAAYDVAVERSPHRVAFLGRDDPRKGLDVLLRAWPQVRVRQPDAELVLIGPDRTDLPAGVTALGRVGDAEKRRTLASSLVFVAPNLGGESFGIVVAEGMAAGCAVVASDIPPFRSVAARTGALTPPGDSEALEVEIVRYLADPVVAAGAGERARQAAARFDWPRIVASYRLAYESALTRHGSSLKGRDNR